VGPAFEHWSQLLDKVVHIIERAIHTRKPNKGNLVECTKMGHYQLAKFAALDFGVVFCVNVVLDGSDRIFDLPNANGPLPASTLEPAFDIAGRKRGSRTIFFNDPNGSFFRPFVSGEAPTAGEALATTAHSQPILTGTGVNHSVVFGAAKRTSHSSEL
jgi:hypothetical protein